MTASPLDDPSDERLSHDELVGFRASVRDTAVVVLLFAAEFAALTIAFDTGAIASSRAAVAMVLYHAPDVVRIGLVSVLFAALLAGGVGLRAFGRALVAGRQRSRRFAWLAGQIAIVAGFALLTEACGSRALLVGAYGTTWFGLWCLLLVSLVGSSLGTLAPASFWVAGVRRHRRLLAASLLLGTAATLAGSLTREWWGDLAGTTFTGVELLLRISGFEVVSDPERFVLGTTAFRVHIAPSCSGYEGLGLVLVFVTGFLVVVRRRLRFPRALWLLPLCVVLTLSANVARIAGLVAIGAMISPDLALGGFHSQAGWVSFNLVAIGTMLLGLHVPWFRHREPCHADCETPAPAEVRTTVYLLPLVVLLGTGMVLAALVPDPTLVYAGKMLAATIAVWCCRSALRDVHWCVSRTAVALGVLTFAVWTVAGLWEVDSTSAAALPWHDSRWIACRVLGSVLVVPIVEELAFRGYLMRRLVATSFDAVSYARVPWPAIAVSSLAFGLVHGWWVAGTLAGVVLALTARRRGLGDAIVAHAVANLLVALAVLAGSQHWLW